MNVDLLIVNGYVLTMEDESNQLIENGAVAIIGQTIEAVGKSDDLRANYHAERIIDANNQLIMPGLIDSHIHTGLAILRGVAQDMSHWMQKGIWPFMKHVTKEERIKGSLVNILEGIKAGTTTFADYDTDMQDIVQHYVKIGARACVAEMVNEMPDDIDDLSVGELYPLDAKVGEQKLQKNVDLIERYHGAEDGRITCMLGPQGADMLSLNRMKQIADLAETYDTKLHMHVAQGDREIEQMEKRYDLRTIPFLEREGFLNERLIAVHLTEATKKETEKAAHSGASMICCPGSIGIIDGIVPPMYSFLQAGGTASLGSDQAPGNNSNNMFNEMKFAAIVNKVKYQDPAVFPAELALRAATIEAAKVLGIDHEVGSLEKGKKADIIVINFQEPSLSPVITKPTSNVIPNLVYSARGHEVETSIIDGKVVMEHRQIVTASEEQVVKDAQEAANGLAKRVSKKV
ncbi:amidohydrolase family protein [Texcoconibacillus texcoconensis]|uniref:5-methylthioadenosine/S-adenosylhomocysteine deaminase n=1 Tax=Texcoconibacillus texcoconensis TaxID=1095777 RepID=A0A840QSK1_9BACI|nr:amidohydrolase family protein [Texcoconibacillus texcoconensis]MBB5174271.1 5-methylthioadenosine/S-adenosylhomocysteine deaminase [Texcoconibacillus texcoconensis]